MKKIALRVLLFSFISFPLLSFAQEWTWGKYGNDPITILDNVKDQANEDYRIQDTALDSVTDLEWSYGGKMANTLDWLRKNINPYIQWVVYIWLSTAVILLIYNWFLMVTNAVHQEGEFDKVKKRFIYILVGVLLLTWFYFIIKLVVALLNSIFGGYGWDTWF